MNSRNFLTQLFNFLIYLFIQGFIIRNLVLFNTAFCYLYLAFLLFLPFDTPKILPIILGFLLGIFIDMFYDSLGIHAAACVFIMYIRSYWIRVIMPRGGYEFWMTPTPQAMGMQWFIAYAMPLIFVHHLLIFFIEIGNFSLFFFTLTKAVASTVFTFSMITVIQYLVRAPKQRIV